MLNNKFVLHNQRRGVPRHNYKYYEICIKKAG